MPQAFRNWSRTVTTPTTGWLRPSTEDEVVDAVRRAPRLKVVGAGHSFSSVAAPEGQAMSLDGLSGLVRVEQDRAVVRGGTRLRDLTKALAQQGLTLPIVGSVQAQSVSGAIATGTHGSSLVHGNLASLVTGMRLVDGTGRVRALTQDDPELDGTRVHLGALGVITELTLRVEPAFLLRQEVEHVPVDEVDVLAAARSAEYVKVWWLPHARHAQVIRYTRTTESPTRSTPVLRWVDEKVVHRVLFPPVVRMGHRRPQMVPRMNELLSSRYTGPVRQIARSTLVLNTPMPLRHRETEAVVPLADAPPAFAQTVDLIRSHQLPVDFVLECRFVQGDVGWLSPASGGDVCQLGAYMTKGPSCDRFFAGFWERMRSLGARPHWGKELDHTADEIAAVYPSLPMFQQLRAAWDPERVFDNAFLRQVLG